MLSGPMQLCSIALPKGMQQIRIECLLRPISSASQCTLSREQRNVTEGLNMH
jgi:hypothetical protein